MLEDSTQVPEPDVTVLLIQVGGDRSMDSNAPITPNASGGDHPSTSTRTDRDGRFTFSLDRATWHTGTPCMATVMNGEGATIFHGCVFLDPSLVLLTRTRIVLRGRVDGLSGGDLEDLQVSASLPRTAAVDVPVFCCNTSAGSDGRFELHGYLHDVPDSFRLVFSGRGSALAIREVPTSELVSERGARITLAIAFLTCTVTDGEGRPLADARLDLAPIDGTPDDPHSTATSDEQGKATLRAPTGDLELCAGKAGYSSYVRRITIAPEEAGVSEEVQLLALRDRDRIRGRVVLDDGSAVDHAYVSAYPTTTLSEVAMAGSSGVYSAIDGTFSIAARSNGSVTLRAFSRLNGMSDPMTFTPDGRSVVLWIARRGGVRVRVSGDTAAAPVRSVPAQMVFSNRIREQSFQMHTWSFPYEVEEIPVGDYNLYLFAPGLGLYGQESVEVLPGTWTDAEVFLEPAQWVGGELRDIENAPIANARIEIHNPDWTEEAKRVWGETRTDANGRFRLLAGRRTRVEVTVSTGTGEDRAFPLSSLEDTVLRWDPVESDAPPR